MFKIGEFSKIAQVSVRMLRYYDENGLLVPLVTDPVTGYRFYEAKQIDELNRIVFLRDMGFGVKEMKEIFQNGKEENLRKNIQNQLQKTEQTIRLTLT